MRISQLNSPSIARNMDKTSVLQASNAAKLATAKQILGAGDDAAGLAISEGIKSQLGGLNMAARNTQDAVSLLKTADGATDSIQSILGRMGELAVQSANGILSNSDREALNTEFNQLREEIGSISSSANFNNISLLNGSLTEAPRTAESVGLNVAYSTQPAAPIMQSTVTMEVPAANAQPVQVNTARFTGGLKVGDTFNMSGKRFEFVMPGQAPSGQGVSPISIFEVANNEKILQAAREALEMSFGDTLDISSGSNTLRIAQKTPGSGSVDLQLTQAPVQSSMVNLNPARLRAGDQITLNITNSGGAQRSVTYTHAQGNTMNDVARQLGGSRIGNSLQFSGQTVQAQFKAAESPSNSAMQIQTGASEGDSKAVSISALTPESLGIANLSIGTQQDASKAISAIGQAVKQVSDQRGTIGAMQNRMTSTLNNINVSMENQAAAQSRIQDLDIAQGAMQNMLLKIQQQAQVSVLAQTNVNAKNILALFQ